MLDQQIRRRQAPAPPHVRIERPPPPQLRLIGPGAGDGPRAPGRRAPAARDRWPAVRIRPSVAARSGRQRWRAAVRRQAAAPVPATRIRTADERCVSARCGRRASERLVHPAAVRDEGVHDRIVLDREVVVVVHVAVEDVDHGAAEVVDRCGRQVEQIARDVHAAAGRNRPRDAAHHGVQVLDRQRVLDGRLRVGLRAARRSACRCADGCASGRRDARSRPARRWASRLAMMFSHPAHLVGHDVDDAWRDARHARRHARTVIAQFMARPGKRRVAAGERLAPRQRHEVVDRVVEARARQPIEDARRPGGPPGRTRADPSRGRARDGSDRLAVGQHGVLGAFDVELQRDRSARARECRAAEGPGPSSTARRPRRAAIQSSPSRCLRS